MTILCATSDNLPGIRPCTVRGEHKITCPDREVNRAIAEHLYGADQIPELSCPGCLPRPADRGYLCASCMDRVESTYPKWGDFVRLLAAADGRTVTPEHGGATPQGYSNLPLTFLAFDECTRLLASRQDRTLDVWVHTEDGARDAIMFAHAAENAYRTLQVEQRETVIVRERCPNCDYLAVRGHTTRERAGTTIVSCNWCGHELSKVRTAPVVPPASEGCEGDDHKACGELACQCACHNIGTRSRPQGVQALWDADVAAVTGWRDRSAWLWDGATFQHHPAERKSA